MRRLPLMFTAALVVLGCGDDIPEDPAGSSSSGTESSGSTAATMGGSSTTEDMTTAVDSSSGPGSVCGNGMVEGDEQCDDGNLDNDDGCYSNCTIPFEILWTQTEDGGDADLANAAVFDAEGNLYVLGASEASAQNYDLWLRQYLPDGSAGWTYTYAGPSGQDDLGNGLFWHESGDLLIIGNTETDTGDDILVMRLGIDDQTPVWMEIYDGPGMGMEPLDDRDLGNSIIAAANGDVLAAGSERVDGQEFDMWLRRYDADGTEIWTQTFDNPDFNGSDTTDGILEDSAGDLYLVGGTEVSTGEYDAWIRKFDAGGTEIWTQQIPDIIFVDATIDAADNLVITGFEDDNPMNANLWVGKYDSEFGELGTTEHDGISGLFDVGLGVAADGTGDIYVAGYVTVVGEQSNIWVARYQSGLQQRWWSDTYGNDDSTLADEANHVAVSDDGSRVAVVGFESVIGEDTNIWVRMYQNNPVPLQ